MVRERLGSSKEAFRIEKREAFDLSSFKYITTNEHSKITMDEYCSDLDYGYFNGRQERLENLEERRRLLTQEERNAIEKEVKESWEAATLERAKKAYGNFEKGLTIEEFASKHMNIKTIEADLLFRFEPEFVAKLMSEIEDVKKQEYEMYLKGTTC